MDAVLLYGCLWSFLILPEVMFHYEQVFFDPFSLKQYILSQFVVGQHAVSKYIGFSDNRAGETALHKKVIK